MKQESRRANIRDRWYEIVRRLSNAGFENGAKECNHLLEAEKGKEFYSPIEPPEGHSLADTLVLAVSDFSPPEL